MAKRKWLGVGVPFLDVLANRIPEPTHVVRYGETLSQEVVDALADGASATVLDEITGVPKAIMIMDGFGTLRLRYFNRANTN